MPRHATGTPGRIPEPDKVEVGERGGVGLCVARTVHQPVSQLHLRASENFLHKQIFGNAEAGEAVQPEASFIC